MLEPRGKIHKKIKDVRASVHSLPIFLPVFDQPTEHRSYVFCEVEVDDGHVGCGVAARFLTPAVAAAPTHDILPAEGRSSACTGLRARGQPRCTQGYASEDVTAAPSRLCMSGPIRVTMR